MYRKRLYIFIGICLAAIALCLVRLSWLTVVRCEDYRQKIAERRIKDPTQLPSIRGSITDRVGRKLAVDTPAFYLRLSYQLTRLLDDRFWEANIDARLDEETTREQIEADLRKEYEPQLNRLMSIINRFSELHADEPDVIVDRIRELNDRIWNTRQFLAWSRHFPESPLRLEYQKKNQFIPLSLAIRDFETLVPDIEQRLVMTLKERLEIMYEAQPVIELRNEQELLEAQLTFANVEGVEIFPEAKRSYPYRDAACHLIGWVGPVRPEDEELFASDAYSRYLHGEVVGRDGIEYVCEAVLRGRRGEVTYDIEGNLLEKKPTIYGRDIALSLDIELQRKMEILLADPNGTGIGAVVQDVATGDVLAMVSVPVYDLNLVRRDYNKIRDAKNAPMQSRAMWKVYPAGSVMKPLILVAGLEEGKIAAGEIISCPAHPAPTGWPNCLMFRRFHSCHDWRWQNEGGNNARNAIKGSCNIYFSQLANRIDSRRLQHWMYDFGYGRRILEPPPFDELLEGLGRDQAADRRLRESQGIISSGFTTETIESFDDLPKLSAPEKRFFGIGQGNLRVTALQVSTAMATIARDGVFKSPRLVLSGDDPFNETGAVNLHVAPRTIRTVKDGMYAVVSETGGTANTPFKNSPLLDKSRDMKIYGKTGSTERPYHAWFAGFVEDGLGRTLALAIVVEGGQAGSTDAAPLAREIIRLCNEAGYIGRWTAPAQDESSSAPLAAVNAGNPGSFE